jgi:short-subunit dehydrogenase
MRIGDARILITGASGGIGAAAARLLHARGAHVVLHGRDDARLSALAGELRAPSIYADLAEPDGPEQVADRAGPVEALVHCAGVGLREDFAHSVDGHVDRLIAVNLRAPLVLARALLPAMCAARRGHLAFVGSIAGLTGVGQEAVYAATKAGLLTFAQSLRLELGGHGVTVSTISPAVVDTGFWKARGADYHRRFPRPVCADNVAALLVRDIATGNADRIVPRWVAVAPAVRAVSPALYRSLALRMDES